jgi:hypothetical protein
MSSSGLYWADDDDADDVNESLERLVLWIQTDMFMHTNICTMRGRTSDLSRKTTSKYNDMFCSLVAMDCYLSSLHPSSFDKL